MIIKQIFKHIYVEWLADLLEVIDLRGQLIFSWINFFLFELFFTEIYISDLKYNFRKPNIMQLFQLHNNSNSWFPQLRPNIFPKFFSHDLNVGEITTMVHAPTLNWVFSNLIQMMRILSHTWRRNHTWKIKHLTSYFFL